MSFNTFSLRWKRLMCVVFFGVCVCVCEITHFLLHRTLQHNRRPHNPVVSLVQVVVLGRVEVCEDEHRLKVGVVGICELLDGVCGQAGRVDVLRRRFTVQLDAGQKQLVLTHVRVIVRQTVITHGWVPNTLGELGLFLPQSILKDS